MRINRNAALAIAIVSVLGLSARPLGQALAVPANDLPNPYHALGTWAHMPAGRTLGAAAGIDIDRDGRSVWVFDRCGANTCIGSTVAPLLRFDASGALLASFGAGMFVYPHGLHVDRDGNVWVTDGRGDKGKGHQVVKFSPAGQVLMTLGKAGVAGSGPDTFNQPSDVLVAPNGDVFVADGHDVNTNGRIVKFSKDGKFIKAWGREGSGPGEFATPHALVMDNRGRLLVGDRRNSRIQIFDQDGKWLGEWTQFGRPSGLFLDRRGMLFSTDSQSNTKAVNPMVKRGVRIGTVTDGNVTYFIPDSDPVIEDDPSGREGVAVDRDGNVYISKTGGGGIVKYVKQVSATQ